MVTLVHHSRWLTIAMVTAVAFGGAGRVARAQDVTVTFPEGWTVTNLSATSADGHKAAGGTRRAILSTPTGRPLAAIELTRELQPSGTMRDLQEAAKRMQAGAGDVYRKAGLAFSCLPARPIQVAGAGGLDIQCDATRDGQALVRQRIIMWPKPGLLASLSYTSAAQEFAAHLDAFDRTLASVTVD